MAQDRREVWCKDELIAQSGELHFDLTAVLDGSNVLKLAFCQPDENIGVQSVVCNAV